MLKTKYQSITNYKTFLLVLAGVALLFVAKSLTQMPLSYSLITTGGAFVTLGLSAILVYRNSSKGIHAKAWVCFLGFIATFCVAEIFWPMCEAEMFAPDSCFYAEIFWLVGYIPYGIFAVLYIVPFLGSISKKSIAVSVTVSLAVLMFSVYYIATDESFTNPDLETVTLFSYTIIDGILIAPMLLGFAMFFWGRLSFSWLLMTIGIFLTTVADFTFLFAKINDWTYFDDPENILYTYAYVFFALGIYYHLKMFAKPKHQFHDQQSLQ